MTTASSVVSTGPGMRVTVIPVYFIKGPVIFYYNVAYCYSNKKNRKMMYCGVCICLDFSYTVTIMRVIIVAQYFRTRLS